MLSYKRYDGAQRTKEWFDLRLGVPTGSRLGDWLAVSKRDGKPLKARLDYERELMFEREFGVAFDTYVTPAMQAGIDLEPFAKTQYEAITGNKVSDGGAFYNDYFCVSPDGLVGTDGGVEFKVLQDKSFTDVLVNGVPENYVLQCQSGLYASGCKWWDFVAINTNTKMVKIVRLTPDQEIIEKIDKSVQEPLTVEQFDQKGLYKFKEDIKIPTKEYGGFDQW